MPEQNLEDISVLLVDDDEIDRQAIRRLFKKAKLPNPIIEARDGQEALSLLKDSDSELTKSPFIVLLDLNMPCMNGFEFLDEIRKDPALTQLVVFVLTTSDDDRDKQRAYERHIAGYIVKSERDINSQTMAEMFRYYWLTVELPSVKGV